MLPSSVMWGVSLATPQHLALVRLPMISVRSASGTALRRCRASRRVRELERRLSVTCALRNGVKTFAGQPFGSVCSRTWRSVRTMPERLAPWILHEEFLDAMVRAQHENMQTQAHHRCDFTFTKSMCRRVATSGLYAFGVVESEHKIRVFTRDENRAIFVRVVFFLVAELFMSTATDRRS